MHTNNSYNIKKITLNAVTNITALDISSNGIRIVVGDSTYDKLDLDTGEIGTGFGIVYVYNYDSYSQSVTLMNTVNYPATVRDMDTSINTRDIQFGASVSINGNGYVFAIGAPNHNALNNSNNKMPRRGAVIIFQYNDVNKSWDRFKTNIFGEGWKADCMII